MATALMAAAAADAEWEARLEQTAKQRLVNILLRELGGVAPPGSDLPETLDAELRRHGQPVCVNLPGSGVRLLLALSRVSPSGHHDLAGPGVFSVSAGAPRACTARALAEVVLNELVARSGDRRRADKRRSEMLAEIIESLENTRRYAATASARSRHWVDTDGPFRFIAAEQSLVFGHPFHPAPKSGDLLATSEGDCRPEMGAAFPLHYLAVHPDIAVEDRLDGLPELVPEPVVADARQRLPSTATGWPLIPVHPWQAERLLTQPSVARLVACDRLLPLGALGETAFPTSSVRTVYLPDRDLFLKLPIDARITNFVRNNPPEHLERTLAASRVLAAVPPPRTLEVLPELGYRGLSPAAWEDDTHPNTASFAVLFRRGLSCSEGDWPVPVAALVEPPLPGGTAPIVEVLWTAARARGCAMTAPFACDWARAYLNVTLVPVLALFVRHGISLEAHVQNTLVCLRDGWPVRGLARDLEGTSISRRRALAQGLFGGILRPGSHVLVDEGEAWSRLLYYVVVNHVAHLLATIASHGPADEWQLWQTARQVLEDAPELRGAGSDGGRLVHEVHELLEAADLPAKANLISRFQDRSEIPGYVRIANPLSPEGSL